MMRLLKPFALVAIFAVAGGAAFAQDAANSTAGDAQAASETAVYLFNTLLYLGAGVLTLFMLGGFALFQGGVAARRNGGAVALRTLAIFSISAIATWLVGYNLLFGVEHGGLLGPLPLPWGPDDADPVALGRASAAAWFYRAAVPAVGAVIIAGTLAERVRIYSLLLFAAVYAGLLYPIEASWSWGGGIIDAAFSFRDFAGASVIHSAAGWAALAAALVLGPRRHPPEIGPRAPVLAVFGVMTIWIGWLGLNAGAEGALDSLAHATSISKMVVNTTLAGAGGLITAMILTQIVYRRIGLSVSLAGAIGGFVSVSAEPMAPSLWQAMVIGAFGGVLVAVGASLLERMRIHDPAHAIPAHLLCGVWGTFIVPWSSNDVSLVDQLVGAAMIGGFMFVMSLLFWVVFKYSIGIRTSAENETEGLDRTELDLGATGETPG